MANIFNESKWETLPTDDDIRNELTKSLGGDFFAIVDSEYLLKLFFAWQNADKGNDRYKRRAFMIEFNLALDRAVKRQQIKCQGRKGQIYSKRLRCFIPVND